MIHDLRNQDYLGTILLETRALGTQGLKEQQAQVCQSICICEGKLNLRPKFKTQKGQYSQGMVGKNLPACSNGNLFISANVVSKVTTIKIASPPHFVNMGLPSHEYKIQICNIVTVEKCLIQTIKSSLKALRRCQKHQIMYKEIQFDCKFHKNKNCEVK